MTRREKNLVCKKNWYENNKELCKARHRKLQADRRKWFNEEILAKSKCTHCPENHPAVLDFHHNDPSQKESEVSSMLHDRASKKRILAEIAKCTVLCSNCHRKHHWNTRTN